MLCLFLFFACVSDCRSSKQSKGLYYMSVILSSHPGRDSNDYNPAYSMADREADNQDRLRDLTSANFFACARLGNAAQINVRRTGRVYSSLPGIVFHI